LGCMKLNSLNIFDFLFHHTLSYHMGEVLSSCKYVTANQKK
jgi:hypothetical protein